MSLKELFQGIAIVIDDAIGVEKANINTIIAQIESENIPVKTYKELPNAEINHFSNLSFILLDWELSGNAIGADDVEQGVRLPATAQNAGEQDNIVFIENLIKNCFCPIFIFSNHDTGNIESKLVDAKLYANGKPNRIFIKSKSDIQGASLFSEIESWLQLTPSMYVLKKWQYGYKKAEAAFFNDFQKFSPHWPLVMWDCLKKDGGNISFELGELLTKNLHSRMSPFDFDKDILDKEYPSMNKDDLRNILQGERFLPLKPPHENAGTGDLFREDSADGTVKYWLNIRAECDLVRETDIVLYCLPGEVLVQNEKGKIVKQKEDGKTEKIDFSQGEYIEKNHHAIVPFVDNGKIIEFHFKEMELIKFSEIKDKIVGRLLPPYITKIQQRFALYLQRQGLPRIPDAAIFTIDEPTVEANR